VAASAPGRRAWMQLGPAEGERVALLEFEHVARLDTDGYPSPQDILDRRQTDFDTLEDAVASLAARGIDTDSFDAPWKAHYPL
jgi:hypothetical protein